MSSLPTTPKPVGFNLCSDIPGPKNSASRFYVGVDGIGGPLVFASAILLFAGIFISWHIQDRTKEFYIFLLILAAATIGVFMSLDLFFLYFFYEMSVLPMYLLLGVWGSHTKGYLSMTDPEGLKQRDSVGFILNFGSNSKEYAAMKLTLFLSAGAVVALMGILLIYHFSGLHTFDISSPPRTSTFLRHDGHHHMASWCFLDSHRLPPFGRFILGHQWATPQLQLPPACSMRAY